MAPGNNLNVKQMACAFAFKQGLDQRVLPSQNKQQASLPSADKHAHFTS